MPLSTLLAVSRVEGAGDGGWLAGGQGMESAAPSHPRSGREDGLPAPWFLHVPGSTPAPRSLTGVGGGRAA